ncbi:MAG: peptidoglycan DD-metalloendopeptidase family protein [Desulfotignum sp.]
MEKKHEAEALKRPENQIWTVVLLVLLAWGALLVFPETHAFSRTPDLKEELIDRDVSHRKSPSEIQIITGVFKSGDTATSVLGPYLPLQTIYGLEKKSRSLFAFNRFKAGHPFQISLDQDGFAAFEYEIDDQDRLVIQKKQDRFDISRSPIRFEIREQVIAMEIETNISAALTQAGHCPSLGWELADIFAWDIDFAKDIQFGDRFQVLVEKRFRHGEYKGYGHILAAEIVNKGMTYRAFRYTDTQGSDGYYDENGRSLEKAFLKSPVTFSKITSYFSDSRFHPILKTHRPHFGVDYSAPKNTPIKTVADGVIKEMGNNHTMGRHMTIQHFNGYETSYYHMNSFAKGMKAGRSVSQGDVIGYVGKTGLATGYHLCFRMTKNGRHVNPLDAPEASAKPVASREMEQFAGQVAQFTEKLMTAGSIARSTP